MASDDVYQLALQLHEQYQGKIKLSLRDSDTLTKEKLSAYYSPGVAAVSRAVAEDPAVLPKYTWTNNLVAVISDGSAVLGLGNIGAKAALPVMEGKSLLFKYFAGIDSVPIVLDAHSSEDIINVITAIAPSFGAINLEDIAAPLCFEIEEKLASSLDIPVMHDDQHGTATVVLAGLINACKLTGRQLAECKIVLIGAGAAGVAIAKLLQKYAEPNVIAIDSKGVLSSARSDLNESKERLLELTNREDQHGTLDDVIAGADIFIGVSQPDLLSPEMVQKMASKPIIFALSNPEPEIKPEVAYEAGAAVVATGRSDYPNQVNNAVAFPGIFRGALDNKVRQITDEHKIAAAETIASLIEKPSKDSIIPSVFDERLVSAIARTIT